MSRTYGAPQQQLAAAIPHRHQGATHCGLCSLPEGADIHHWEDRLDERPQPKRGHAGPWGQPLLDGDDPTQRGYAEDAYQTVLTGEPR